MDYIYHSVVFTISVFVWAMIWSNLLLPWIYSIPKFYWYKKQGLLTKPIPFARTIYTTAVWMAITYSTLYVSLHYLQGYLLVMNIAAVWTLIYTMLKFFRKDPELLKDFLRANKERLR